MGKLTDMPNIGKVIEGLLSDIGVKTPEDLIQLGSKEAFIKIRTIDSSACIQMLYGLEGAVRGVKDRELPAEAKQEIKEFYRFLQK